MTNVSRMTEINEAKAAGREALQSLREAEKRLSSAKNWGIWDMFGGGFFSTMIKHSKINDASALMEDAQRKLQRFTRELRDVDMQGRFRVEMGEFLTVADYVFDNVFTDMMVQSRIGEAREQVAEAIRRVEGALQDLDALENAVDVDYEEV